MTVGKDYSSHMRLPHPSQDDAHLERPQPKARLSASLSRLRLADLNDKRLAAAVSERDRTILALTETNEVRCFCRSTTGVVHCAYVVTAQRALASGFVRHRRTHSDPTQTGPAADSGSKGSEAGAAREAEGCEAACTVAALAASGGQLTREADFEYGHQLQYRTGAIPYFALTVASWRLRV